ncbi:hypothetical protein Leryth_013090 [Lithospermum erythrorhizon]|nr:hypothetical protein Leryth_013090 [Lithospermum erythrorhizon]
MLLKTKVKHQQYIMRTGNLSHAKIVSSYLLSDSPSQAFSALVYVSPSATELFYWNSLIKHYVVVSKNIKKAISIFITMRKLGWQPDGYTYPYVLKASGELPCFFLGASVHGCLLVSGFEWNVFVCNAVVAMYGRCGSVHLARQMFDEMTGVGMLDVISWNSICVVYVHSGDFERALEMFGLMVRRGGLCLRPDVISLVNVLAACASLRNWRIGKEIHCCSIRRGLIEDVFVGNGLVDMYAKCGLMDKAEVIFDRMEVKDVVSWNAMVTGYSQIGQFDDALGLLKRMRVEEIELNVVGWSAVIAGVTWTVMIGGYAQHGDSNSALELFSDMMQNKKGVIPNSFTISCALVAYIHLALFADDSCMLRNRSESGNALLLIVY